MKRVKRHVLNFIQCVNSIPCISIWTYWVISSIQRNRVGHNEAQNLRRPSTTSVAIKYPHPGQTDVSKTDWRCCGQLNMHLWVPVLVHFW